jgi:hypothetical protein
LARVVHKALVAVAIQMLLVVHFLLLMPLVAVMVNTQTLQAAQAVQVAVVVVVMKLLVVALVELAHRVKVIPVALEQMVINPELVNHNPAVVAVEQGELAVMPFWMVLLVLVA